MGDCAHLGQSRDTVNKDKPQHLLARGNNTQTTQVETLQVGQQEINKPNTVALALLTSDSHEKELKIQNVAPTLFDLTGWLSSQIRKAVKVIEANTKPPKPNKSPKVSPSVSSCVSTYICSPGSLGHNLIRHRNSKLLIRASFNFHLKRCQKTLYFPASCPCWPKTFAKVR